jgi:hypothetical protein
MIKLKPYLFLLIGILTFSAKGQPAKDCTRNRIVQADNRSLYLNKGEVYDTLKFIGWAGANMRFLKKRDTVDFLSGEGDPFNEQGYPKNSGAAAATRGESPGGVYEMKKDTFYKVIYVNTLYYDTMIRSRDYYMAHKSIQSVCDLNDTFNSATRYKLFTEEQTKSCRCYADSTMYGLFKDFVTGEELKIHRDLSVSYKSLKNPKWVKLSSSTTYEPGFLQVWFTGRPKEKYDLFYTGDTWLIPGIGGKFGRGPQFFKPIVSK